MMNKLYKDFSNIFKYEISDVTLEFSKEAIMFLSPKSEVIIYCGRGHKYREKI